MESTRAIRPGRWAGQCLGRLTRPMSIVIKIKENDVQKISTYDWWRYLWAPSQCLSTTWFWRTCMWKGSFSRLKGISHFALHLMIAVVAMVAAVFVLVILAVVLSLFFVYKFLFLFFLGPCDRGGNFLRSCSNQPNISQTNQTLITTTTKRCTNIREYDWWRYLWAPSRYLSDTWFWRTCMWKGSFSRLKGILHFASPTTTTTTTTTTTATATATATASAAIIIACCYCYCYLLLLLLLLNK